MSRALVPLKPQPEQHELREDVDFQVSIKVRNGRFLGAVHRAGFATVAAFCRKLGLPQQTVNGFATMTLSPLKRRNGQPTKLAQAVADALNTHVDELFPPRFLSKCLEQAARTEVPMTEDQIGMLLREPPRTPEDVIALDQAAARISDTLILLPPREERLLRLRHGMGVREEMTQKQAGEQLNASHGRAGQIEENALRKLRLPNRKHRLVEAARTLGIGEFIVPMPTAPVRPSSIGIGPPSAAEIRRFNKAMRPRPLPDPNILPPPKKKPKPPPEPKYYQLLRIPEPERSEQVKFAIAYHLEEEIVRRGGTRICPNDAFLATWEAMSERDQKFFKYDWFKRHWDDIWNLFPPEPRP